MLYKYNPMGVCSMEISFEMENDIVSNVKFFGGCAGNTKGVASANVHYLAKMLYSEMKINKIDFQKVKQQE